MSDVLSEGWKYIASSAMLIFSFGFAGTVFIPAHAEIGPSVSSGGNPYASFYGAGTEGANILTVPANSLFIVTTFLIDHNALSYSSAHNCELHIDGSSVLVGSMIKNYGMTGNSDTMGVSSTSFIQGTARLAVSAGSSITIGGSGCNTSYYIEGYYAHL
jgi:hypothetical protein